MMLRTLFRMCLVVSVLLTGYGAAYARGMDPAVDRLVICAGHVTSVIYVDAQGNQTTAPHLCPDCTLHVLGNIDAPLAFAHTSLLMRTRAVIPVAHLGAAKAVHRHRARAPPVML